MLVKHFKELLKSIPDDMTILFDDGNGIYMPLASFMKKKVSTFAEPGDEEVEFYDPEDLGVDDLGNDIEEYDSTLYGADVTTIEAIVFSTEKAFEGP